MLRKCFSCVYKTCATCLQVLFLNKGSNRTKQELWRRFIGLTTFMTATDDRQKWDELLYDTVTTTNYYILTVGWNHDTSAISRPHRITPVTGRIKQFLYYVLRQLHSTTTPSSPHKSRENPQSIMCFASMCILPWGKPCVKTESRVLNILCVNFFVETFVFAFLCCR